MGEQQQRGCDHLSGAHPETTAPRCSFSKELTRRNHRAAFIAMVFNLRTRRGGSELASLPAALSAGPSWG